MESDSDLTRALQKSGHVELRSSGGDVVSISEEGGTCVVQVFDASGPRWSFESTGGSIGNGMIRVADGAGGAWMVVDSNGDGIPDFRNRPQGGQLEKFVGGQFVKGDAVK